MRDYLLEKLRRLTVAATLADNTELSDLGDELRGCCLLLAGVACDKCGGTGSYTYPTTATWRKSLGVAGMSLTQDVCDICWGTGRSDEKGIDRRKL